MINDLVQTIVDGRIQNHLHNHDIILHYSNEPNNKIALGEGTTYRF